jgi:TrmH family RNA methyltransferase
VGAAGGGRSGGAAAWRAIAADFRRAETATGRRRLGRFAIEGMRVVERALRAGVAIDAVLIAAGVAEGPGARLQDLMRDLRAAGCRIELAPDAEIERLTEGRGNGPIVGLVRVPPPLDLAALPRPSARGAPVLLAAVDVEDPGNVGALVRTALAGGCVALAAAGISDPFHPRAVRTSMGSLFKLPILRYAGAPALLDDLARAGWTRVAAASEGGAALPDADLDRDRPVAVLLGSEAFGLPEAIRCGADRVVTVPMAEGVDSYSVNAAAAVILYEIARRRRAD